MLAGENTGISVMADNVETSVDEIIHGHENTPVDQGRTTQNMRLFFFFFF